MKLCNRPILYLIKFLPVMLLILLVFTGCKKESVLTPSYDGKNLTIGVIGVAPEVRENNIKFKNISLHFIKDEKNLSSEFDAVFIMKEYLAEAANSSYATVYRNSGIPFFFIQSTKSYLPFVNEQISYDDPPDMEDQTYATGIFKKGGQKYQYWGYGLYNDKVNENNIKDVYTRIFSTIELVK